MHLERWYLNLVSERQRGIWASALRTLLWLASWVYALVTRARAAAYKAGLFKTYRVPRPVISIGNVTTGGTGKTPMVEYVVKALQDRDCRVAVVSRGYGGGRNSPNDEALVLQQNLPGVPHVQHSDRVRAARQALLDPAIQAIVLDDGFQHLRLKRALDLVLIDARNPFGFGHVLPRGLLREPLTALRRASMILISRADLVSTETLSSIKKKLRSLCPQTPLGELAMESIGLQPVDRVQEASSTPPPEDLTQLQGTPTLAFAGIGNPEAFFLQLETLGAHLVAREAFPDHHPYTQADLDYLSHQATAAGAQLVVTTQKDAVKLCEHSPASGGEQRTPIRYLAIAPRVIAGAEELAALLKTASAPAPPSQEEAT